jgi:hypothetical protein
MGDSMVGSGRRSGSGRNSFLPAEFPRGHRILVGPKSAAFLSGLALRVGEFAGLVVPHASPGEGVTDQFLFCLHPLAGGHQRQDACRTATAFSSKSRRASPSSYSGGIPPTHQQAPASCPQTAPVVSASSPRLTTFRTASRKCSALWKAQRRLGVVAGKGNFLIDRSDRCTLGIDGVDQRRVRIHLENRGLHHSFLILRLPVHVSRIRRSIAGRRLRIGRSLTPG